MTIAYILAQTGGGSPSFAAGQSLGAILGLALMGLMVIGAIYIMLKWPDEGPSRFAAGVPLLVLPFTGWIIFAGGEFLQVDVPPVAVLAVPIAWLGWLLMFSFSAAHIRRAKNREDWTQEDGALVDFDATVPGAEGETGEQSEGQDLASASAELSEFLDAETSAEVEESTPLIGGDAPVAGPAADAPLEAGHSTGPRRAVSLPASGSESSRPSEQTLKRMSPEKMEEQKQKKREELAALGPRAIDVPGNPILPEGAVKIRCLSCDKKMRANGEKLQKQRRCPNCKASPFRYTMAV